jgi:hypothetical protein
MERERSLREVESVTHCAIEIGLMLKIMSEVNCGRRGNMLERGKKALFNNTVRDRTKGRNAGFKGDRSTELPTTDRLVIARGGTSGCDVAGADKMVDSVRISFLSF